MAALQAGTDRTAVALLAAATEDGEGRGSNVQGDSPERALLSTSLVVAVCRKTPLGRSNLELAIISCVTMTCVP